MVFFWVFGALLEDCLNVDDPDPDAPTMLSKSSSVTVCSFETCFDAVDGVFVLEEPGVEPKSEGLNTGSDRENDTDVETLLSL